MAAGHVSGRDWGHSGALYYGVGSGGPNQLGGRKATAGTEAGPPDENHHLAKVRVAGSIPVFHSIVAGQKRFFNP